MADEIEATRELADESLKAAAVVLNLDTRAKLYRVMQFPATLKALQLEAAMMADIYATEAPELPDIELPAGLKPALERAFHKPLR